MQNRYFGVDPSKPIFMFLTVQENMPSEVIEKPISLKEKKGSQHKGFMIALTTAVEPRQRVVALHVSHYHANRLSPSPYKKAFDRWIC